MKLKWFPLKTKLLIVCIAFFGSLADAKETKEYCFSEKVNGLCFYMSGLSSHYHQSYPDRIKKTGSWVEFCFNQNIQHTRSNFLIHYLFNHTYPDGTQNRSCVGAFDYFADQYSNENRCVKKYGFVQAGTYQWSIQAKYNGYTEKITLDEKTTVTCSNCE